MHTENKTNTVSLSVSTWVFMAFFMLSPICAAEKMDILFIAIDDMNDWTTVFDKKTRSKHRISNAGVHAGGTRGVL